MRGIPKRVATREDVFNVSMDLPPARVLPWLDALAADTDTLRRIGLSGEHLQIIRNRVIAARQLEVEKTDHAAALRRRLADARTQLIACRRAADLRMLEHRAAQAALVDARIVVAELETALQLEVQHG